MAAVEENILSSPLARWRFTVADFRHMGEAGLFDGAEKVELLHGEIFTMSPIESLHAGCVGILIELFGRQAAGKFIVWVQNPIEISDESEPIPDIVLLKRKKDFYKKAHPKPADVLLVIEVADTAIVRDRDVKLPLYAGANIPEAWLVNLPADIIEVHSGPINGAYREIRIFKRGEKVASTILPKVKLNVSDILG
jgi:Uma2 family endonuclease